MACTCHCVLEYKKTTLTSSCLCGGVLHLHSIGRRAASALIGLRFPRCPLPLPVLLVCGAKYPAVEASRFRGGFRVER